MRLISICLLALVAVSLFAGPAAACMNDREVIQAEREFKSRYLDKAPQPEYQPEPSTPTHLIVLGGTGGVMLLGAMTLGFVKTKKS